MAMNTVRDLALALTLTLSMLMLVACAEGGSAPDAGPSADGPGLVDLSVDTVTPAHDGSFPSPDSDTVLPDATPGDADSDAGTGADAGPPKVCPGPKLPPATSIGFNYAPQGHLAKWVGSDYAAAKPAFELDLVLLASIRVRVVRIMLLPYTLGLQIKANIGPGQWNMQEIAAMKLNLPKVIDRFSDFGISVILALGPNAYYWNGPSTGEKWWEVAYGKNGWQDFVKDVVAWNVEVVKAVEQSSACSNVIYYDLNNEVSYETAALHDLFQAKLSGVPVPPAKRGISLLRIQEAGELAKDLQATGVPLAYLEFHSYPDRKLHTNIATVASSLASQLPGPTVLLGELGSIYCENGQDEVKGAQTVGSILNQSLQAKLPVALHWMLWDRKPGTSCTDAERVGLGFERDLPRDAYGVLASLANPQGAFDFEQSSQGWHVGGTTSSVQMLRYSGAQDAATGLFYNRMKVTAPGTHWHCSPAIPLGGKTKLAAAGYVRSNLGGLTLDIHFKDATGTDLSVAQAALTPAAGWAFGSLQSAMGAKTFAAPPGATSASLCVVASAPAVTSDSQPIYVDVDAVTLAGF